MSITITKEMLGYAYEYLACQPPFNKWNLPPSEEIKFSVIKKKDRFAHYQIRGGVHHIVFSTHFVGRHETLLATMAHELIHLHTEQSCIDERNPHGKVWSRFADTTCKIHEFDRKIF